MEGDGRKLYVGRLKYTTTEDTMKRAFEEFGKIQEAVIMYDRVTGRSRGFGFVTYEEKESADEAQAKLDNTELDGRTLLVKPARKREGGRGGTFGGGGYSGGFGGGGYGGANRQDYSQGGGQYGQGGGQYSQGAFGNFPSGNYNYAPDGYNMYGNNYGHGGAGYPGGATYGGSGTYTGGNSGGTHYQW